MFPIEGVRTSNNPDHRCNPHLYEINTVPWLFELSQKSGTAVTLGRVPTQEWDRVGELGFDFVWLMGVWQKSPLGRQMALRSQELHRVYDKALPGWMAGDVIGSPYSIRAYEPDRRMGNWVDLEIARSELRKRGMKLILDFVPNHTGPDHPWIRRHPEYFVQASREQYEACPQDFIGVPHRGKTLYIARGKDPNFPPWQDTAQLDYFQPQTRSAMVRTLKEIGRYCDGFRCDMAMLVLNDIFAQTWKTYLDRARPTQEFWSQALAAIPGMLWIAEAYWDTEWRLQQIGFDYVYDKRFYDRIRHSKAQDIRLHLTADLQYQQRLIRFIENHDEPRSAAEFDGERLKAAALLLGTLPGMRLFHHGQLTGRRTHQPLQLLRAQDEAEDELLYEFYCRLLAAARHDCFHQGEWKLEEVEPFGDETFRNLIGYSWRLGPQLRVVVVNWGDRQAQGRLRLSGCLDTGYRLHDVMTGRCYRRNGLLMKESGLHVILAPHQGHLFDAEADAV